MLRKTFPLALIALAACSAPTEQETLPPTLDLKKLRKGSKPTATSPGAAEQWRRQIYEDENGMITPDGIVKAIDHRDQMLTLEFDNGGIQRGSWNWMGPGNVGGRCRGLWIQPTNANVLVLGSAGGGIWRSADAGRSWNAVEDFPASLAIGCVAGPPRSSTRVWAGTGEGFGNGDAIRGAGIYSSFDSGKTFARLSTTANPNFYFVNRIAFHPTLTDWALVATGTGIWRTTNGGVSFTRTYSDRMLDVKFHPTNGNLAICAGRSPGSTRYSLNAGASWTAAGGLPSNVRRVELAYSKSNPAIVYASCELSGSSSRVYRSTNGGRTYFLRSATGILGDQGWYDNAIWVDPTNSNIIVVGGIGLFRSLNGGATFTNIGGIHADQHAIVSHPGYNGTSNRQVYVCNDGGIYRATDIRTATRTSGWVNLNNRIGITQFYGGAISVTGRPVGGTQDNGTQQLQSSTAKIFRRIAGADGMLCQADPTNSNILYGETQYAYIFRSMNGGNSTQSIHNNMADVGRGNAPWIGAMRLDPNNANRMWMGSKRLWRSDNVKTTNPASVFWRIARPQNEFYTSVDVAKGNSNIVVAAQQNGRIFRSTNATAATPTWTQVDGSLPNRYITKIRIHPRDPNQIYVSFGGFTSGNVWRTVNAGATWTRASGSGATALPAAPVRALALHPDNEGWIYAGTEVGVFASTDNGLSWSTSNDGPATVSVDEIVVRSDGSIYAFTHGRGLYRANAGTNRDVGAGTTRASLTWLDAQANGHSYNNSVSGDGRFVAFGSDATNLVALDSNGRRDIFVRDRQEGTTTRVSVTSSNLQANNSSFSPDISADGRFVAFGSIATNLVPGDSNARRDIFVRDRTMDLTERVSVSSFGAQGNGHSYGASVSSDGRYVVFYSTSNNLAPNDQNTTYDVFRHDRKAKVTLPVSYTVSASSNSSSFSSPQAISDDGRFVVFHSNSSNLVAGDTNGTSDIFLREYRTLSTTLTRVSLTSSGGQANGGSYDASISGDGRFIAFYSLASNLVSGDTNNRGDVFLYDRATRRTTLVSRAAFGSTADGTSTGPVISADGNHIAFESDATNLTIGDSNARRDIYVMTRSPLGMRRASVSPDRRQANNSSNSASISSDGKFVGFYSGATNLVDNDTNGSSDVFVYTAFRTSSVFPKKLTNIAGSSATALPLSASNTRLQQIARETVGQSMAIQRISFRRDTRSNNTVSTTRTIDLSMDMGSANIDAMTNQFSRNYLGIPRNVISRKRFSVPDWRIRPAGVPAFNASFPLDSPYLHSGTNYLLWDMTMYANSSTGTHFIDAHSENLRLSSTSRTIGIGCDTNTGRNFGHSFDVSSDGPSTNLTIKAFRAPRSSSLQMGLGVSNPNLQLPNFCTRIYTDALTVFPIGNTDTAGKLTLNLPLGPWDTTSRGLVFYTQAFTLAGGGFFSHGLRTTMPVRDPGPLVKRLFASPRSNTTGTLQDFGAVFKLEY